MKATIKYGLLVLGGLLGMWLISALVLNGAGIDAEAVEHANLIEKLFWPRLSIYLLLVAGWLGAAIAITRLTENQCAGLSQEEVAKKQQELQQSRQYLVKQWWKIAVLLVFMEAVVVQQLGFA